MSNVFFVLLHQTAIIIKRLSTYTDCSQEESRCISLVFTYQTTSLCG
jgi:hypothetical protein